ncbi:MAG: hypothetical protein ACLGHQ_14380 [Acidimicrobiia bacterium]
MDDLDRRLRAIATEALDREAATVPVDDDLAAVRALAAERPKVAPTWRRPWTRLAVAATIVLFATGAVVLLATRDGGDEVVAPPATDGSSTSGPVDPTALAVAEPSLAAPGSIVRITPASNVAPRCPGAAEVYVAEEPEVLGWIEPGEPSLVPAPLVDRDLTTCEMAVSADPQDVLVPEDMAPGRYRLCVDEDSSAPGCAIVEVRGVVTSTTLPARTTTTVAPPPTELPVGYFERVAVDEPPYFEIRQVAADGSGSGTLAAAELDLLLAREVVTGPGGNVRLLPEVQPYGRCDAREVAPGGATTEVLPELAAPVRSLAATPDGVVVVGVDVCPDGTAWGDPGTRFELRRIDLVTGTTTVLHVREPGDGDTFFEDPDVVYAGGELLVESVSADGAYVAVAEPYTTEDTRYHVFDAVTGGEPLTFASACEDPRDLVGPPQFVGEDLVVLARECSPVDVEIGDLIVELVSLETRAPLWSMDVDHVAIDSYSSTVSLDATELDGRVWALVSGSAGVEQPIRAAAITDEVEQPLPGGAIAAFDPQELIEPWDPYPG